METLNINNLLNRGEEVNRIKTILQEFEQNKNNLLTKRGLYIHGGPGSGKTTFTGKLGAMLKKQGRQVLLVACDVYRPAAVEQLKVVGSQAGVEAGEKKGGRGGKVNCR